ncbi:MAG: B12-binding domain-containing radical SAM protein [Elusimicrobia bacterium]|nr:B12-binding domain-containing radical SAM protein [Elusimicrobiota bacterium]
MNIRIVTDVEDDHHDESDCHVKPAISQVPAPIRHRSKLKKVLLIQPPAYSDNFRRNMNPNAPLGIAYIGAMLERHGYEVKILDAFIEGWDQEERINHEKIRVGLSFAQIKQVVADYNPDVVGITSMFTSQRKNAHAIAKLTKEVDPEILVVAGGAHVTSATESVLEDPCVDITVLAEGDNVIVPLLQKIEANEDIRSLDGIGFRDPSGAPVVIQKITQIENLDDLPFPARHLLPMEKYFSAGIRHGGKGRGQRAASMITSRGCQYRCNFCTAFKVFTRKPRMRSIENVVAEIELMKTKWGIDEIFFEDDQIIAKQRRAGDLFDAIAKFGLQWDTPNGVSPWLLTDDIIAKMKNSGCYRINIAIESGNQWVLDNIIDKPVKLKDVPRVVDTIRRHGMEVGTYLVVGNIGRKAIETLEQVRDSFRFARKLKVYPHTSLLTAYPGSEVLDIAKAKGYLVPGFDWDNLIIQKFQLQTPEWTPQQLMALVDRENTITHLWALAAFPMDTLKTIVTRIAKEPFGTLRGMTRFTFRSFKGLLAHA